MTRNIYYLIMIHIILVIYSVLTSNVEYTVCWLMWSPEYWICAIFYDSIKFSRWLIEWGWSMNRISCCINRNNRPRIQEINVFNVQERLGFCCKNNDAFSMPSKLLVYSLDLSRMFQKANFIFIYVYICRHSQYSNNQPFRPNCQWWCLNKQPWLSIIASKGQLTTSILHNICIFQDGVQLTTWHYMEVSRLWMEMWHLLIEKKYQHLLTRNNNKNLSK